MGKIKVTQKCRAPIDRVYSTARDPRAFIGDMPNIKDIDIIEQSADGCFSKAEWILDIKLPIKHGKLSWIQEIEWLDGDRRCRFRLSSDYEGIVKKMEGVIDFKPAGDCTQMDLELDFLVKHPLVSSTVQGIFDGIMRKNNEGLLKGIRRKAEKS